MKGFLGICSIWLGFFSPGVRIFKKFWIPFPDLGSLTWGNWAISLVCTIHFLFIWRQLLWHTQWWHHRRDLATGSSRSSPLVTWVTLVALLLSLLHLQVLGVPRAIAQELSSAPQPRGSCGNPRVNSFGSKAALPCAVYINTIWFRQVAA